MLKIAGFCVLILSLSSSVAYSQTNTIVSSPEIRPPTAPGVDVWQTLYPRPPQSNPPTATLAPQADDPFAQPKGYTAGAFTFYPSVTGATYWDDNVFALSRNRLGDIAFVARPEVSFKSNGLDRAEIYGSAAIEGRRYATYSSEDQLNAAAGVGGTFAINDNTQFVSRLQYTRGHEDRGTSDTILTQFDKPIGYSQYEGSAALNNRFDRFWTSVGGAAAIIDYDVAHADGVPISQDYRNGTVSRIPVRVGYVVAPLTSVFVEGAFNSRDFKVSTYDSTGYRVVGGMLFEPGPGSKIKGEFYAGYMDQNYNGFGFDHVSSWTAGGAMAFLVTDRLTFAAEGQRQAKEASPSGGVIPNDGVSIIESIATARADYRLLTNLVIGGGISYISSQYMGISRTDDSWSPLASIKYFVDPHLTVGFDYRYVTFGSDGFGVPAYTRNVYLFSANARF
jgi:hypothetical protein